MMSLHCHLGAKYMFIVVGHHSLTLPTRSCRIHTLTQRLISSEHRRMSVFFWLFYCPFKKGIYPPLITFVLLEAGFILALYKFSFLPEQNLYIQLLLIFCMLLGLIMLVFEVWTRHIEAGSSFPVPINPVIRCNLDLVYQKAVEENDTKVAEHSRFTILRIFRGALKPYLVPAERCGAYEDHISRARFGLGEGGAGQAWSKGVKQIQAASCTYQEDQRQWATDMKLSESQARQLNIHPNVIACIPIKHDRHIIAVLSIDLDGLLITDQQVVRKWVEDVEKYIEPYLATHVSCTVG